MVAKVIPVRAQALPKQDGGGRDRPPPQEQQQQQQQQSLRCSPDKDMTRGDCEPLVSEETPPPGKAGDSEQGHGMEVPTV